MKGIKTGGRMQGVPNHSTTDLKRWVKTLLETNQATFEADLMAIEPKDRLQIMATLLKYSIPTLQSVSIETELAAEYSELKRLLDEAPDEAIELISNKILTLKAQNYDQR